MTVWRAAEAGPAKVVVQDRIWPVGANQVQFHSPAASPSGSFAVGGTAISGSGAFTGFLGLFAEGKTPRLVQLPNTGTAYDVVRHYSADGSLLGSAVPRASFQQVEGPLIQGQTSVSTSPDTIGIYFDGAGYWTELTTAGVVRGTWQVTKAQAPSGWRVTREQVLMTSTNKVIRVITLRGKQPADSATRVEVLAKAGGSLTPMAVDSSAFPSSFATSSYLVGTDGNQLLWMTKITEIHATKRQ